MVGRKNIFLHFLNRDSREIFGLYKLWSDRDHYRLLRQALNYAVLLCEDHCIAPPGFVVEDPIAFSLSEAQVSYLRNGLIRLPMRESSLNEYADKKRKDYFPVRNRYSGLYDDSRITFLSNNAAGLIKRKVQISENIASGWQSGPDTDKRVWAPIKKLIAPKIITELSEIPDQLLRDESAVTWSAIEPRLPEGATPALASLRNALQYIYFTQYCREFDLVILESIPYAVEEFYLPRQKKVVSYTIFEKFLGVFGLDRFFADASASLIAAIKFKPGLISFTDAYVALASRSSSVADMAFRAGQSMKQSTFDWKSFGRRHNTLLIDPTVVELEELDDAMSDMASILSANYDLEVRGAPASQKPTKAKMIITGSKTLPKLVLYVALQEELTALADVLDIKVLSSASPAAQGTIGGVAVDVLSPMKMGRVAAAVEVSSYLAQRKGDLPDLILVVGLAGGFKQEGSKPGHTICVSKVVDLALRKVSDSAEGAAQSHFRRQDYDLDERLRRMIVSSDFDRDKWSADAFKAADWPDDQRPAIRYGPLASLDEVVASDDWSNQVHGAGDKLLGVEMEAGGVCAAAHRHKVPVAMLRVVSDQADPAKADDAWRKRGIIGLGLMLNQLAMADLLQTGG